jgi:hypothetical protein
MTHTLCERGVQGRARDVKAVQLCRMWAVGFGLRATRAQERKEAPPPCDGCEPRDAAAARATPPRGVGRRQGRHGQWCERCARVKTTFYGVAYTALK